MDALLTARRQLLLGGTASVALAACGRPQAARGLHLTGSAMASDYNVKLAAMPADPQRVRDAVHRALTEVDGRMSIYREDSELSALNRLSAGRAMTLSSELVDVLDAARRISERSDGAFDVTVQPLVQAWGFGTDKQTELPADAQLRGAQGQVGWRDLHLDTVTRTARKARADLRIDLGGIAKGYAVDRAAQALHALGIDDYMVEAGGEVRTHGRNANGQPWQIGIEQPDAPMRRVHRVVPLSGAAMATSGDYRIFFERDGRRYSHEIDPRSAQPITHALCSVSVVAADCMQADALATALIVLGPQAGWALAQRESLAAYFMLRDGQGGHLTRATDAFAALGARAAA